MTDQPTIFARIKKLLALSKDTCNLNEAAVAAQLAQRLMEQHKIAEALLFAEDSETAESPISEFELDDENKSLPTAWKVRLAGVIARLNGCHILFKKGNRGVGRKTTINIFGSTANVSFCMSMWWYVVTSVEVLCRAALKRGEGKGQRWANSFRVGAVDEVCDRLKRGKEEARTEARKTAAEATITNSMALVRVENALAKIDHELDRVNAFLNAKYRTTHYNLKDNRKDGQAYAAGRAAGARLNLNLRQGNELKG